MFAIFFINICNRSNYVLIFNFFSDKYLIRSTEDLKIQFWLDFLGKQGYISKILQCSFVVLYFMNSCTKFQVSNLNFNLQSYQKTILCAQRLRVYVNLGVCSSYGLQETLSGYDTQTVGRTDIAYSIFIVALINNTYTLFVLQFCGMDFFRKHLNYAKNRTTHYHYQNIKYSFIHSVTFSK